LQFLHLHCRFITDFGSAPTIAAQCSATALCKNQQNYEIVMLNISKLRVLHKCNIVYRCAHKTCQVRVYKMLASTHSPLEHHITA